MSDLRNIYPSFSVLMSVYKKEQPDYLDEALTSIEQQTVTPNEIVLVEDGPISTDLKRVILKHKKVFGKGFKDVVSKKNQGLGVSLRLGTKYISNKWIARMDSDDISVPNRFELQLKEVVKNPDISIIGGQVMEFEGTPAHIVGYRHVPLSDSDIRDYVKWRNPFNHPTVMINKKVLCDVGGYVSFGNLEDYYLWAKIILNKYHVTNLDQVLVYMRADEGMYKRRGKIANITIFYKLRKFLWQNRMINYRQRILGDILMTINIVMPSSLRKFVYQKYLHREE